MNEGGDDSNENLYPKTIFFIMREDIKLKPDHQYYSLKFYR